MFEKFKQIINRAENLISGNSSEKKGTENVNVFGDNFKKKNSSEISNNYQVSKKVWVNGQAFNIVGKNEEEIKNRVNKLNNISSSENLVDTTKYLFSCLYTEQREVKDNEWTQRRDVWVNEYCPA
ncbi:MAG: hypothetical protein U0457_02570 [Candidatus Sericytochromatia bacterium]